MTTYQLLLNGAIEKTRGNGRRFYDALKVATVDDLQRAETRLSRYGLYPWTHKAKRLKAISARLAEIAEQAAVTAR